LHRRVMFQLTIGRSGAEKSLGLPTPNLPLTLKEVVPTPVTMTLMGTIRHKTAIYKSLHRSEAEGLLTARRIYQPASLNKPLPALLPASGRVQLFLYGVKKTIPLKTPALAFTEAQTLSVNKGLHRLQRLAVEVAALHRPVARPLHTHDGFNVVSIPRRALNGETSRLPRRGSNLSPRLL